jgi:GNAT superfamily N-acetyltransferase
MPIRIERATPSDIPTILEFIRELAIYEKHLEHFVADHERLSQHLFGSNPKAQVLLAYESEEVVAFAVYYFTFSTFEGRPGIYLEDLFVKPECRGKGIGKTLLSELARVAKSESCWRIEWSVLRWNENAIKFYEGLGAIPMDDWAVYRIFGEPLDRLAAESSDDLSKP